MPHDKQIMIVKNYATKYFLGMVKIVVLSGSSTFALAKTIA